MLCEGKVDIHDKQDIHDLNEYNIRIKLTYKKHCLTQKT